MSDVLFTADTHFGHALMLERRGMMNTSEHDIRLKNSIIDKLVRSDRPTLYLLGDASFRSATKTIEIMRTLRDVSRLVLIRGNHDRNMTKTQEREAYDEVHDYLEIDVSDEECPHKRQLICMMHYPLQTWRNKHWGAWMLHGHWHGRGDNGVLGRLDVGVDALGFESPVVSYSELKDRLVPRYGQPVPRAG